MQVIIHRLAMDIVVVTGINVVVVGGSSVSNDLITPALVLVAAALELVIGILELVAKESSLLVPIELAELTLESIISILDVLLGSILPNSGLESCARSNRVVYHPQGPIRFHK